jgi:hypothetical protein
MSMGRPDRTWLPIMHCRNRAPLGPTLLLAVTKTSVAATADPEQRSLSSSAAGRDRRTAGTLQVALTTPVTRQETAGG